jgi:hypothetical protein
MDTYRKIKVQLSFLSLLLVIIFSCLIMWALTRMRLSSSPNTTVVLPTLFLQLELCLSISIASLIPCFRILFQSSEKQPIRTQTFPGDNIKIPDSYTMISVGTNTSTVEPSPRKAEHSAASSQDVGGARTNDSGARISESSFVPSGQTNTSETV